MNNILEYGRISDQQDSGNPLKALINCTGYPPGGIDISGVWLCSAGVCGLAFATDGGGTAEGKLPRILLKMLAALLRQVHLRPLLDMMLEYLGTGILLPANFEQLESHHLQHKQLITFDRQSAIIKLCYLLHIKAVLDLSGVGGLPPPPPTLVPFNPKFVLTPEKIVRHCGLVVSTPAWEEQVVSSIPGSVGYISQVH